MSGAASLHLYAVVPAAEAGTIARTERGLRHVGCGPVAAAVGRARRRETALAARHHDRIVGRLLAACSSVVPFRLGIELGSDAELCELLQLNLETLCRCLARARGRVEMGARVRMWVWGPAPAIRLESGLGPIRALVPNPGDRRERLVPAAGGRIFEGSYLIRREAIEAFWTALDESRSALGDVPVLGSGPWAAYSFCDVVLRARVARGQETKKDGDEWQQ